MNYIKEIVGEIPVPGKRDMYAEIVSQIKRELSSGSKSIVEIDVTSFKAKPTSIYNNLRKILPQYAVMMRGSRFFVAIREK